VRVEEQQDVFIGMLFLNQRANGSPLTRQRVGRQAAATVINKEVITQDILRGYSDPAVTFQPRWSQYYDGEAVNQYGVSVTREDVVNARDMLRESDTFTLEEA